MFRAVLRRFCFDEDSTFTRSYFDLRVASPPEQFGDRVRLAIQRGLRVASPHNEFASEATLMKRIKVLTTASVFLLPGTIASVYAQGQREQEKQPE